MKWKKFKIKTVTDAEDIIISTLYDIGLEGAQIEDKVPLTALEKEQMFVDILPDGPADDGRNERSAVESLSQEDACYLIRQATLEDMLQELRAPAHRPAESLEKRCERIYRSWGLSTYDANKRYLTGALRMMMGSDHRLAIRKEILGPVAEEYNLTVAAVDSALRRLLETLDETGTQTWRDFRKEYGLERRKVTIGRLLYALESKLSQQ